MEDTLDKGELKPNSTFSDSQVSNDTPGHKVAFSKSLAAAKESLEAHKDSTIDYSLPDFTEAINAAYLAEPKPSTLDQLSVRVLNDMGNLEAKITPVIFEAEKDFKIPVNDDPDFKNKAIEYGLGKSMRRFEIFEQICKLKSMHEFLYTNSIDLPTGLLRRVANVPMLRLTLTGVVDPSVEKVLTPDRVKKLWQENEFLDEKTGRNPMTVMAFLFKMTPPEAFKVVSEEVSRLTKNKLKRGKNTLL